MSLYVIESSARMGLQCNVLRYLDADLLPAESTTHLKI